VGCTIMGVKCIMTRGAGSEVRFESVAWLRVIPAPTVLGRGRVRRVRQVQQTQEQGCAVACAGLSPLRC